MEGAVLLRHVQLLDLCDFRSGKRQHRVEGAFCIQIFFFFDCWMEFSIVISKGSFASVRIKGKPPLLGLLITQGLFSEDGTCCVLTAHLSAFLYICGVVCYGLVYDLCDSTKASWVQGLYCLSGLFVCHVPFACLGKGSEDEMQD